MLKGSAIDLSRLSQIELDVEGFYMTGLRPDIVHVICVDVFFAKILSFQHACFLLALMQHVRFHMSLSTLERGFLKHEFKDRLTLEVEMQGNREHFHITARPYASVLSTVVRHECRSYEKRSQQLRRTFHCRRTESTQGRV